jgi:hypothetical protein
MPVSSAITLFRHLAGGLYRNMSEIVRTCAIYLGIAVLVATVMVSSMPGLRSQALQMHGALLYALAPDAYGPPPSAITQGPIAPIVGAISMDAIPGDALPALSTGSAVNRPVDLSGASGPAPTPAPAGAGPSLALAKAAEPAKPASNETSAQILSRLGVSPNQQDALIKYISRKYLIAIDAAAMFVDTTFVVGSELRVDPLLLLSVIATESRFNPYAGSQAGGPTGLMQVVLSVHRNKFSKFGRAESMAFNPVANVRVGGLILADCISRRGSVQQGLLCYCGASGASTDGGYTEKVMSERRRLALAGSITLKD